MKVATNFYIGNPLIYTADELIIKYAEGARENLASFAEGLPPAQRLIVNIVDVDCDAEDLAIFVSTYAIHKSFAVLLSFENKQFLMDLYGANIPFIIAEGVKDVETLYKFINLGVKDVYCINDFCFNIKQVSAICKSYDVSIRVMPNIAQREADAPGTFDTFFIRPEDLDLYSQYIDVIEFYGQMSKQPALYDIYFKSKRFIGDLRILIHELEDEVYGENIPAAWAYARLSCGHDCTKCDICDQVQSFDKLLRENGVVIINEHKVNEDIMHS